MEIDNKLEHITKTITDPAYEAWQISDNQGAFQNGYGFGLCSAYDILEMIKSCIDPSKSEEIHTVYFQLQVAQNYILISQEMFKDKVKGSN